MIGMPPAKHVGTLVIHYTWNLSSDKHAIVTNHRTNALSNQLPFPPSIPGQSVKKRDKKTIKSL